MLVIAVDIAQCYDPPVDGPVLQLEEILATSQYVVAKGMAQEHQSNSSYSKQTSPAATLRMAPRHATGDVNSPDARAKSMWSTMVNMRVSLDKQGRYRPCRPPHVPAYLHPYAPRHAASCDETTGWRMVDGGSNTHLHGRTPFPRASVVISVGERHL